MHILTEADGYRLKEHELNEDISQQRGIKYSYACLSVRVAARSRACTVFVRSNTRFVGSNPTGT
jgi:hypothetical protein